MTSTPVFTAKIDRLAQTVQLAMDLDHGYLSEAIERAASGAVTAIGSGGSAVSAEFLAYCRSTLLHGPTIVSTPMSFVLDPALGSWKVWLFSASGDNPDVRAALQEAANEHAGSVDIVTVRGDSHVANHALLLRKPRLHITPVAEEKDGFLATHSLVSALTCMLLASDCVAGSPQAMDRMERVRSAAAEALSKEARARFAAAIAPFSDPKLDTLLILHDPALASAAVMIETDCWEAGICAVQRTDFRNFAHGRHVWLNRHPERTFVLGLTMDRTRSIWESLDRDMPRGIARHCVNYGPTGRHGAYRSVLGAFGLVEALGAAKSIDPGKPGFAEFGRTMFERDDLIRSVEGEDTATRRKRRAEIKSDMGKEHGTWPRRRDEFMGRLALSDVGALVLDYDGTVVTTERRIDDPGEGIVRAIVSLVGHGLTVAFATGRGGSVGQVLRKVLPAKIHSKVLIGYYNGAYIRPLDVDIELHPAEQDPAIARVFGRIVAAGSMFQLGWTPKAGPLQITIPFDKLSPDEGRRRLEAIVAEEGDVKIVRSGHSFDICPTWASKRLVVARVGEVMANRESTIVTVGDSGDIQGNDYELLEGHFGLSVDRVCHRHSSCWNLLPGGMAGPDGLLRILQGLKETAPCLARLDVSIFADA